MSNWKAGVARTEFHVPVKTPMAGYVARNGPSLGTLDVLTISALALEDDAARLVLLTVDLAAVDRSLVDEIATATHLDRSELVVCASHTHSGPAGIIRRMHPADADQLNPKLRATFVQRCAEAIRTAQGSLVPVELIFGQAETHGLAANRNKKDGPFDPRVSVLATRTADGALTAVLVHFACHPTVLNSENRMISADYLWALRMYSMIELAHQGQSPMVLFSNGAAGDVSTRFTRVSQGMDEVARVGAGLANAVLAALETAQPVGDGIAYAVETVRLTPRSLESASPPDSDRPADATGSVAERRKAETRAQGAVLLGRLAKSGPGAIQHTFELPAWRLGALGLVAVPGELFASLGAEIVASADSPALVLGYANGYVGYLVDDTGIRAGTYEALASPFAPDAGALVVEAATAALSQLKRTNP